MLLPPRTAEDVSTAELDYFVGATPRVTDLTEGSVIRSILEATGREIARLEIAIMLATNEAIEQSTYMTFGFAIQGATPATGDVNFILDPAALGTITIPKGTVVSVPGVPGKSYETIADVSVLLTGSPADPIYVTASVVALQAGSIGNAPQGTVTQVAGNVVGILGAVNPKTIFNGNDIETDAERRVRFAQFIKSLQRATKDAILVGAKSTRIADNFGYVLDEVRKVSTVENNPLIPNEASGVNACDTRTPNADNPRPGTIWVFVHNGVSTPTQDLVDACAKVLEGFEDTSTSPSTLYPGWRAAAIECKVFPAAELVIPVQISYEIWNGYIPEQVEPGISRAISDYFSSLDIADTFLVEQLKRAVINVAGVKNFSMATPTSDITCSYKQIAVQGPVTLTLVEDLG